MLPQETQHGSLTQRIEEYRGAATRVRGLPLRHEIAVEKETREQMMATLEREMAKPENRAFMAESEALLRALRVLTLEEGLAELYKNLMQEQVLAYYDADAKRMAYIDENVGRASKRVEQVRQAVLERFVYVHEFCHAIEDSHYDLEELSKEAMCSLDQSLAFTSLAEGNAVLIGMDGVLDNLGMPGNTATPLIAWLTSLLGGFNADTAAEGLESVPPLLAGVLLRPYLDGTVFSNRLRRDAGWRAIDQVYTERMPQTTAEILYPERRYLRHFRPAKFQLSPEFQALPYQWHSTNTLGVMGMALWLEKDGIGNPRQWWFLKGWCGDRIYLGKDRAGGGESLTWLSYWERPGMASAFRRRLQKKLARDFSDCAYDVSQDGRMVVAVWQPAEGGGSVASAMIAQAALRSVVEAERVSSLWSWLNDLPMPCRFPSYPGFSTGFEVAGGYAADMHAGENFSRWSLLGGLALRSERNPDRYYYGALAGLLRHTRDERMDFTYWQLPLIASWHRRGEGADMRYRWSVLWGILADGDHQGVRVLFVPVWKLSQ